MQIDLKVRKIISVNFQETMSESHALEVHKNCLLSKFISLFTDGTINHCNCNNYLVSLICISGAPAAGVGCQLPPKIEPRRRRKRIAKKADS